MAKTIVFCATEEAAERMRLALVNQNSDMVKQNPDYVVRITGSDNYGKSKLDYFISVAAKYPVIATTSKLLSTGSDCKMTKLIVLDEMIGSMTEFKQIIGRGTRPVSYTHLSPEQCRVWLPDRPRQREACRATPDDEEAQCWHNSYSYPSGVSPCPFFHLFLVSFRIIPQFSAR